LYSNPSVLTPSKHLPLSGEGFAVIFSPLIRGGVRRGLRNRKGKGIVEWFETQSRLFSTQQTLKI
jgi:hypothetical protein